VGGWVGGWLSGFNCVGMRESVCVCVQAHPRTCSDGIQIQKYLFVTQIVFLHARLQVCVFVCTWVGSGMACWLCLLYVVCLYM